MNRNSLLLRREEICRLLGILAMAVWAAILLSFYFSGRIHSYIRPEYLRTASLVGGLGLGLLSLFNLFHLRNPKGGGHCCQGQSHTQDRQSGEHAHSPPAQEDEPGGDALEGGCGGRCGGHAHDAGDGEASYIRNVVMFLVMVMPVLLAAGYSKDRYLSAATIRNKGFVENPGTMARGVDQKLSREGGRAGKRANSSDYTLADLEQVVNRSAEGNLMLTIRELFCTSVDAKYRRVLTGQQVETVGQVIPDDRGHPHLPRLRLFTLLITCCAADAQPVSIPLEFRGVPPAFEPMTWVKVSGTVKYLDESGQIMPLLRVKSLTPTAPPQNR